MTNQETQDWTATADAEAAYNVARAAYTTAMREADRAAEAYAAADLAAHAARLRADAAYDVYTACGDRAAARAADETVG